MDPFAPPRAPKRDPDVLLLEALAWVCGEDDRAERLLSLTGLGPDELRARATDPAVLGAVGDHLLGYEADLIACAEDLACDPAELAAAARTVTGG
jgi:hypothetical protein